MGENGSFAAKSRGKQFCGKTAVVPLNETGATVCQFPQTDKKRHILVFTRRSGMLLARRASYQEERIAITISSQSKLFRSQSPEPLFHNPWVIPNVTELS